MMLERGVSGSDLSHISGVICKSFERVISREDLIGVSAKLL